MGRFPKDCWSTKCKHFKVWDMSVDDLCCKCTILNKMCDACDEDFSYYLCPLPRYKQFILSIRKKARLWFRKRFGRWM